jgi:hypothetical protein
LYSKWEGPKCRAATSGAPRKSVLEMKRRKMKSTLDRSFASNEAERIALGWTR